MMEEEKKVEVVWSVINGEVFHTGELIPGDIGQSVAKWKAISKQNEIVEILGSDNCTLCFKYSSRQPALAIICGADGSKFCLECPVYKVSGQQGCKGTPYEKVVACRNSEDAKGFRAWARLEYLFLKALADGDTERAKHYLLNEA